MIAKVAFVKVSILGGGMRFVFSLVLVLLMNTANADENMPVSCKPITVDGESVMLSAEKPVLVMIHNQSKTDLWITHPVSDPSASAGWSSRLQAGNWSALALDKESFELTCIESKPGHEQQVPCTGVISACRWSSITMPAQTTGTFWAGEDMSISALTAHLGSRGFELPASSQ
ncbi:Uncharacterised protein [Legionella donaldsonii]|uniref:Enhanced entry protein EnhB n=2 Tax=Legionellaceae TaxID=444 RepID=A0A378JB29_9GAMM|nr:Uncharacterised protein [Legionella donaldsonii]